MPDYEKAKPLTEAPSGIIGLETSLALGNEVLVDTGELTMMQLLTCMTMNPAKLYRLDAGYLAENGPADLVLFDPAKELGSGTFLFEIPELAVFETEAQRKSGIHDL